MFVVVLRSYACLVCSYRIIWVCMCVWGWIWAVSAAACGLTVVDAAIFAQASLSRLGESIRVLTTTRARLGDLSTFWATPCLAQARRSRLSEKSWTIPRRPSRLSENSWRGHVTRLAWARMREKTLLPISPEREFAASGRLASRLSEFARVCYVSLAVWGICCMYHSNYSS